MYRIINRETGKVLSVTEKPTYITKGDDGCFVLCPEKKAVGVVCGGVAYTLFGKELDGTAGTTLVTEMDGGMEIRALETAAADMDAMAVDQELRLTMLELGVE